MTSATHDSGPTPTVTADYTQSLFHSAPWREAVEECFGLVITEFVPASEPDASIWYSVVDDMRGLRIVSTPFSDFCEPRVATETGWNEFTSFVRSFECPIVLRPFANPIACRDESFTIEGGLVWHGVDLADGADAAFAALNTKVRTKIRRPAKDGVTFRASSDPADIATMHAMHVQLRKNKYGMLAQPKRFFDILSNNFGEDMVVVFAEVDGEPIAGMTFFAWNGVWYYKFSASVPNRLRPNPAVMMHAIRIAAERGLTLVDMGRSDADQPGLLSFKEQFEPLTRELSVLTWRPADYENPTGAAAGATLGALTTILTASDVPESAAAAAGDTLYRYFA